MMRVTFLVLLATTVASVGAINANPAPFRVTQPDSGKNITLRLLGGEHFRWLAEGSGLDARTVVRNQDGVFVYAERNSDGSIGPSFDAVGEVDPEARRIPKNLLPSDAVRDKLCKDKKLLCGDKLFDRGFNNTDTSKRKLQANTPAEGNIKNLVVLMRWSDHKDRTLPSVDDIDVLMNSEGPHPYAPTGSVKDVYRINSYGKLNLTSTVYKWVTMDNTETYYADGESGTTPKIQTAIKYALEQLEADSSFDFGDFDQNNDGYIDAIAFLHSGYGAETGGFDSSGTYYEDRIWSHKWDLGIAGEFESARSGVKVFDYHISPALWGRSGSRIGRVGVIAHETGHFFGLPDLYDTQRFGQGIGSWCLMANSWGFDGSQYYPPHLSAWSRIQLGWDDATLIEKDGVYKVAASEVLEEVRDPKIYKIEAGFPEGEYLLIENRQPLLYDTLVPKGGLAVWKIDEKQLRGQGQQGFPGQRNWPENGNHYRIALLQADTSYHLEKGVTQGDRGDLFHADGNDEIGPSVNINHGPYPNTDAYQGGNVYRTGNRIYEVSVSDGKMSFRYQKLQGDPESERASGGVSMKNGAFLLSMVAVLMGFVF